MSEFCLSQKIDWSFIPEHAPQIWQLVGSSHEMFKTHLKKVTLNVKLTFEVVCTFLTQIEACLNSRPLVALPSNDDCIEALTLGHFLISNIVILQDNNLIPTKWPLASVINVHPGSDQIVRVVTVKTSQGTYNRPITKVALLLSHDL